MRPTRNARIVYQYIQAAQSFLNLIETPLPIRFLCDICREGNRFRSKGRGEATQLVFGTSGKRASLTPAWARKSCSARHRPIPLEAPVIRMRRPCKSRYMMPLSFWFGETSGLVCLPRVRDDQSLCTLPKGPKFSQRLSLPNDIIFLGLKLGIRNKKIHGPIPLKERSSAPDFQDSSSPTKKRVLASHFSFMDLAEL